MSNKPSRLYFSAKDFAREVAPEIARMLNDRNYRPPATRPEKVATVRPEVPNLSSAINEVLKATDRLEADQYTRGEHAAIQQLIEAAKRLRTAARRK
ncbi:hypothetical protein AM571_CH03288 [Rhizobium etli 8C-3]|uniref:Uncharacterized protein n=1 Tax=Rhizobium etli 8C-3 TaxID=538025 RepID=A0A1L5P7R4_RHIET|nr:hypothetical protein [Rhizobium etli]APO76082.1 hypothetical protein AM571_CH03288 [Rhizobium etli 8C-3]